MVAPRTIAARLTSTGDLYTVGTFDDTGRTVSGHSITKTGIFAEELDELTLTSNPNSGGSVQLNGTSQRLDVTGSGDFMFGTNDFTIEAWFFLTSSAYARLWCFPDGDNIEAHNGILYYWNGGGSITSGGAGTAPQGRWNHVALEKYNNVVNVYLNGISIITDMSPFNSTASRPLSIGGEIASSVFGQDPTAGTRDGWLQGYITNIRIVKGFAVYRHNFSTAYNPLTALPNTVLLLNVADSGHLVTDSSGTNKSVTNIGTATFNASTPLTTYFNGAMKQLKNGALLLAGEVYETISTLS
jgi:hypothetical protein